MKLFRLPGGIHPHTCKTLSSDQPIQSLPLPEWLHIPLQQHIGAPAKPVVKVGDLVYKGQVIAVSQGAISAPVHASTSGKIAAIGNYPAPHPSGLPIFTITLKPDGEDRWLEQEVPNDPLTLSPEAIAMRVNAAGIVGLGGATFPTAVKLNLGRRSQVHTLIINGSECEPYLTCDDRLMRERTMAVVKGIRLIRHAIGAQTVLVGIEDNKSQAIAAMQFATLGTEIQIVPVPTLYPMGSDRQLVQVLTGKEVPADGRLADAGLLMHNVGTAYAVYQAIYLGRPLVSRIVTVSGGAVAKPSNLEVPMGTLVEELFRFCGGFRETPVRLLMGGPMMGIHLTNTQVPVIKGTSGVLAFTAQEISCNAVSPCIRCANCLRACPVGLLPLEMAAHIRAHDLNGAIRLGLKDCIACGSCAYVCPAHIPLVHYFSYAKGELVARERIKLKQEATRKLAEERIERQARLTREREAAAAARQTAKEKQAKALAEAI
ncbi:electron transport complex, RnfABCDGE type, C subunit [Thioploca ingrica]|uniref:Ion-translocating oxidoreductase complex subunit C n=1 Tax=Thioploca ingrica TaxID=40754 RepID=A0A090AND9_9GAMM|nr:electron transport complex, RnfABCDGE type, C subunit [Thioploca ingrica]